jgi:hypothetical protein
MKRFEPSGASGLPARLAASLVVLAATAFLAACPGLEIELNCKVLQEPNSSTPSLAQLPELELIERLPPRTEQYKDDDSGFWWDPVVLELGRRVDGGLLTDPGWRALLVKDVLLMRELLAGRSTSADRDTEPALARAQPYSSGGHRSCDRHHRHERREASVRELSRRSPAAAAARQASTGYAGHDLGGHRRRDSERSWDR